MTKNFNLSKSEFEKLRLQLIKGDESLFKQIFLSHFEVCCKFLRNKFRCSSEDAYDATMETLIEFRQKIISGKIEYNNLNALFNLVASQNLVRSLNQDKKKRQAIVPTNEERKDENDVYLLDLALKKLGDSCNKILNMYYYDSINLQDIAEVIGSSYVAIRKQKERCLDRLRSLLLQITKTYK